MRLTVVVDGGGTGSRIAALDEAGTLLAKVDSTPANLSLGAEQVWLAIQSGLAKLAPMLDQPEGWMPDTLWCGVAGSQQAKHKESLLAKFPSDTTCNIINDGHAQLLGCANRQTSLACLGIGTGSVLNYLDHTGKHIMQGGWGFPVGDEGGGAWLGMRAVNRLLHWHDTKFDLSKMPPLFEGLLQIIEPSVQGILEYSTCKNPKKLAQLAPIVFDTAPRDQCSRNLINEGVHHLHNLIAETNDDVAVYVAGGLAKPYLPYLEPAFNRDILLAPDNAAIYGLYSYAKRAVQVELNGA